MDEDWAAFRILWVLEEAAAADWRTLSQLLQNNLRESTNAFQMVPVVDCVANALEALERLQSASYDLALVPAYAPSQHLFVTDLARLARVELRSSTPIAYFRGERTSRTHGNCVDAYLAAHVAELCSETMVVSGNDDDEHAVAMTHGEIADPASARALASQHSELRSRLIHELLPEVARQRRHEMREAEWGPGPCSLTRYTQRMSGGAAASTPDDNEVFSQFFMVDLHHEQRQQSRACAAAPFVLRRSSRGGVLSGTAGSN